LTQCLFGAVKLLDVQGWRQHSSVKWTASAQQGLRSFDLQYSTNGGMTWLFITQGLVGSARNFSWHLPASSGIPDVRVRVIARDQIFQDSSDGSTTVFSIAP
jgi:hypothetical protein